ncbi:MAG: C4-type zinc ribbon domain-containing protein [Desulfobacterales bacterium]|jgi:predicted  nucleic acid-binding Zn-ribbon protein
MPDITKEQISALVKLQQIEIEISNIKEKLGKVNQRFEELDGKQLNLKQVLEQQESTIKEMNHQYRAYESDAQANLDRIKKSEAKLHSVKTNKEYQSSLKEIDDLKEKNSKLEDEMIEFLERIEEADRALKAKSAAYAALKTEIQTEKETIQREAQEQRLQLDKLNAQWKTLSESIDAELLDTFNRIKANQTNKIGIVAVSSSVCQGCHMNIPPQLYNELQRGDKLQRCPICERIIYWEDQKERSE